MAAVDFELQRYLRFTWIRYNLANLLRRSWWSVICPLNQIIVTYLWADITPPLKGENLLLNNKASDLLIFELKTCISW